jgi:peptidoglycan lytic transglycosylase
VNRRLTLAIAVLAPLSAAAAPRSWMDADPQDSCESGLREAVERSGFAGPVAAADELGRVAATCPDTAASGLAHLAAGMLLLDAAKGAAALPLLRQADISRTALSDYATLAQARALDATSDASAAGVYLAAVDAQPDGPEACGALERAAELFERSQDPANADAALERALTTCPARKPSLLLAMARLRETRRDPAGAAEIYRRIDRDFPASPQAVAADRALAALGLPIAPTAEERNTRDLRTALAFFEGGEERDAAALLRSLETRRLTSEDMDLVRTRLGRCLMALKRTREARAQLSRVGVDSPSGAEAAFYRGRLAEQANGSTDQIEAVPALFPGSPWAEEALLALANHYQKDARDEEALPYYRRLLQSFPNGRYADRAAWKVGWGDYRQGRLEEAALTFERAVRVYPKSNFTPGMLYWAGRARSDLRDFDRARQLLTEVIQRYKRTYHGLRAQETLASLPGKAATPPPSLGPRSPDALPLVPEPWASRVRQLMLIDRLDEAAAEIRRAPADTMTRATLAWIETRRGRLRAAINVMKAAHPEYLSEAGDELPDNVWKVLYPIQYFDDLRDEAVRQGLDPALVAALVCQESTFDAGAVSRAGARGLMQVMPHTGRTLARSLGVRFSAHKLHDPATSLEFGTHYLRGLMDRFGGRVERVLAAYNAGPERVEAWTAAKPDMSAEEFIESIPFTETRLYVMIVLSSREQYRRLYDFSTAPSAAVAGSPRP